MVYSFINFIIPLPATCIRHSRGNCQILPSRLLKQIQRIVKLRRQKDCWGTAEVNDAFKLLPRQLYCRRLCSWNANAARYFDRFHAFSVTICICYKDVYVNSFFPRTTRLWNSLPIEYFPLTYDLSSFKSRINRHLLSVGSFKADFLYALIFLYLCSSL